MTSAHTEPSVSLIDWFWKEPAYATQLSVHLDLRLLLVGLNRRDKVYLLYDTRHDERLAVAGAPLRVCLFGRDDRVARLGDSVGLLPKLSWRRRSVKYPHQPLWKIAKLDGPVPDPQTLEQVETFFAEASVSRDKSYSVTVVCASRQVDYVCAARWFPCDNLSAEVVEIQACTGYRYELCYRIKRSLRQARARPEAETTAPVPSQMTDEPWQKNRSATSSCRQTGLNLARDLGLLSRRDCRNLSFSLGKTVASLFLQYDERKHLRHVTYRDCDTSLCTALPCYNLKTFSFSSQARTARETTKEAIAVSNMRAFFEGLWLRRQILTARRRAILTPLLDKLAQFPETPVTRYQHLRGQLRRCVERQLVVLYCRDDADLHAVKFYLADFLSRLDENKPPQRVSLALKISSGLRLRAIQHKWMSVVNVADQVELDADGDFFGKDWTEPLPLQHRLASLKGPGAAACKQRGSTLAGKLLQFWSELGEVLLSRFGLELHSTPAEKSFSYLCFEAVSRKYVADGGVLARGCEKIKPYYARLLRESSGGGFAFSVQEAIRAGDRLYRDNPDQVVRSIAEYDLNSCYGYAAANAHLPGGFCVGYLDTSVHGAKSVNQTRSAVVGGNTLERADTKREESFEFRAVYYTLHRLLASKTDGDPFHPIAAVYSSFHPAGNFQVQKHILDLAVAGNDGSLLLYNFDGAFAHSCDTCPRLSRYINDKSHAQLRSEAQARDGVLQDWTRALPVTATYTVFCDCHDLQYKRSSLEGAFVRVPELAALVRHFPKPEKLSVSYFLAWLADQRDNDNFTFMAWVRGSLPKDAVGRHKPIVQRQKEKPLAGHRLVADTGNESTLLSRDYLEFLVRKLDFRIEHIDTLLFFDSDKVMNNVFRELVNLRFATDNPVVSQWLKRTVNFSIGYFGYNESKRYSKYRLTNRLPRAVDLQRHSLDVTKPDRFVTLNGSGYFTLQISPSPRPAQPTKPLRYPLALNIAIVEYGKLRLVQFLHFLETHLDRDRIRLVYCNIDNCHLASSCLDLDDAVLPQMTTEYLKTKPAFITEGKLPGLMKLEWRYTDPNFKYVTARIQNHAVVSSLAPDRAKLSGVKQLSPRDIYRLACQLLDYQTIRIPQEIRKDPVAGSTLVNVTYVYKPK